MKFYKTLNYSLQPDCIAGQQLTQMVKLNCSATGDGSESASVIIRQAYNPKIILGQDAVARQINQMEVSLENQNHDISLTFQPCTKTWSAHSKLYPTVYTEDDINNMLVKDIETCELLYPRQGEDQKTLQQMIDEVNLKN